MLQRLLLLVRVSRPLSWPLVALLYLTGLVISHAPLTFAAAANGALAVFLLPLVVFGVNDVYDYASDTINRRKGSFHGAILGRKHHRFVIVAAVTASLVLAVFSLLTRNMTNVIATAVALCIAWVYSSPPIRLKELPILDSLSNAALIWSVILTGFSYGAAVSLFPSSVYFASLGASAIHAIAAMMDYTPDSKAGVKTIATFFGKRWAATFALAIMLAIVLFSGIASIPLRIIIWYVLFSSLILVIRDNEMLAKRLFKLGYLPGLIALAVFIFQQFYE